MTTCTLIRRLFVTLAAVGLFLTGNAASAASEAPRTEEINVYADMSLRKLRLETNRLQEVMFDTFNEINSDDRFDIECGYVKRWQSKIREYECAPVFLKNAREEEVNLFFRSVSGDAGNTVGAEGGGAGVTQMDYFNALLEKEMTALVREHEEFRQAVDNYNTAREVYDARRR